jgi:hypothetical protein
MKPRAFIRILFFSAVVAAGVCMLAFSKKQTSSKRECQDQEGCGQTHSEFIIWESFTRNILGNG